MRYNKYINEQTRSLKGFSLFELNKRISEECKPYLRLIKNKHPLYRGMDISYSIGIKDVRQNRRPLGMTSEIAKNFNKWLSKNGHVRRDQSVILTSDKYHSESFGENVFHIFPIGKFNYTWIKTKDVNISDTKKWDSTYLTAMFADLEQQKYLIWLFNQVYPDFDKEKVFSSFFHTNKGFNIAYDKGYELWMNPKQYYFVNVDSHMWDNSKQRLW